MTIYTTYLEVNG